MKSSFRSKRVLAALLSSVALLALVASCEDAEIIGAQELVQRAQESRAKGDLRAATVDLKSALTKEPNNAQAHLLLGQTYLDFADGAGAEKEFERAIEVGVKRDDVIIAMAEAWLIQGQNQKVLDEVKSPPTASNVARAAAFNVRGRALLNMARHDDARAEFDKARQLDPNAVGPLIGLARIALERRQNDVAEGLLKEAQAIAPGDGDVQMLEGDFAYAKADYPASEAIYAKVLEKRPFSPLVAVGLARAQLGTGKLDEAAKLLDGVLRLNASFAYGNYLRGLVAFQKQDFATARNFAEKAALIDPGSLEVGLLLGASAFGMGEFEVARKHLEVVLGGAPNHLTTRRLLAATLDELGERDKALALLAAVPGGPANSAETLAALADEAIRMGSLTMGVSYLADAVAANPSDTGAKERLGLVLIALGDTEEGLNELEEALKAGGSEYTTELARVLAPMQKRDFAAAMVAAEEWHKAKPELALPISFIGLLHVLLGDITAGKERLNEALVIEPGETNAVSVLAKLAALEGKLDEARKILDDGLALKPDNPQLLLESAKIETIMGRPAQAQAILDKLLASRPGELRARRLLAQIHFDQGDYDRALAVVTSAPASQSGDAQLLIIAGRAQLADGNTTSAVDLLRQSTQAAPQNPETYFWLAAAQNAASDPAGVEASLLKALDIEPNHEPALLAMMRHLGTEGRMDEIAPYLSRLRLLVPENPEIMQFEAAYAMVQGRPADSVVLLEKAQAIEPTTKRAVEIARAKVAAGDAAGALQTMEAWSEAHPDDLIARFEYATLLQGAGRNDDAIAAYEAILAKTPDSITSLNNLAWVLLQQGKIDEALVHAERAHELDTRDPVVMDTLAALWLKKDRASEALPLLRQASEALPSDPNVHVHLAMALAATGKKDEALDLLQRVLSASTGTFDSRAEGEALLAELSQ